MSPAPSVKKARGFRDIIIPLMYVSAESDGLTDPADLNRLKAIIKNGVK